jgi:hypothetical protein
VADFGVGGGRSARVPTGPPRPRPPLETPARPSLRRGPPTWLPTAALICGLAGLPLFFSGIVPVTAIGLGWFAARHAGATEGWRGGRGRARAGMLLGVVGVVACASYFGVRVVRSWDDRIVNAGQVSVGDCVRFDFDTEIVEDLPLVDCDDAHEGEVFHTDTLDMDPGATREARQRDGSAQAQRECMAAFGAYVGQSYGRSTYATVTFLPFEDGWDDIFAGFACVAVRRDGGELIGPVRQPGG